MNKGLHMGLVIALAEWPKQTKLREAHEGSAEVIIFTGVRFERLRNEIQPVSRNTRLPNRHNQATAEELE